MLKLDIDVMRGYFDALHLALGVIERFEFYLMTFCSHSPFEFHSECKNLVGLELLRYSMGLRLLTKFQVLFGLV